MKRSATVVATLLAAVAASACGGSTDVKIRETKLPSSYANQAEGRSVGQTPWRDYFKDEYLKWHIGSALAANPDVHIALQRIELARAGVRQATGVLLPQVAAFARAGIYKPGRYTPDGAGNATTDMTPGEPVPTNVPEFAYGLNSTWEIDAWGKLRNRRESAAAQYLASIQGTHFVLTALVADVAAAYFELLALDHARDVLSQTVVRQEKALEVVKLQKVAGRANELAVQQFEAQLANTRALETDTVLRVQETENRLNALAGRYPQPVPRNKRALLADVPSSISSGLPSALLRNRPDISEAELLIQAAKCDLRAARAEFYPSISINAGIGFEAFNPKYLLSVPESLAYSASIGLVAPLINRAAIEAQFDAAKAYQIQALYNYQKVVLNAFLEVSNGLLNVLNSAKIVALKKQQKAAVQQTVDTADSLYRAGKATYFEVLMAQQNTLSAELELIEALKDQHLASIFVYRALGGGWR